MASLLSIAPGPRRPAEHIADVPTRHGAGQAHHPVDRSKKRFQMDFFEHSHSLKDIGDILCRNIAAGADITPS